MSRFVRLAIAILSVSVALAAMEGVLRVAGYRSSTDPASWKTLEPNYNAAVLEVGRDMGVPVIDVYAAFRDREEYFDDESHFGVEGHRVAAELIHAELATLIGKP